ncbi:MAG: hypothetical protein J0I54_12710 [Bosea sp.]|uniref:hypothetical protein n=1 Tax=unclassified Bosea (in: a-proteobacteria) TaxID=2653178 RepID=UPI000968F6A3|nr:MULTISPECIES: hypothetical protein [unclassified Bosea (in: a-proteobacteria)]MBN9457482.1 hypothetical protein [Bosea sp. (in: a-proteobacteria)]OJV09554.1 MAG: hypothetical protein BGO20_02415 [Bosea sp. 67-29]
MDTQVLINGANAALPAKAAATIAADVIAGCFEMMEGRELDTPKPLAGQTFLVQLGMPSISPADRADMYRTWLLSKGFHNILKGLRTSFEEAYLYVALFQKRRIQGDQFRPFVAATQKKAGGMSFVALVDEVSKHLTAPLAYRHELLSMQKARNRLEHRNGTVSFADATEKNGELLLRYPRLKVFYERAGQEIEVGPGAVVDTGDDRVEVQIFIKRDTYERRFALGEHLILSSAEFIEIAMATCLIADDLVAKMPRMTEPGSEVGSASTQSN